MWINSMGHPLDRANYSYTPNGIRDYHEDCANALLLVGSTSEIERIDAIYEGCQGTLCIPQTLWETDKDDLLNINIDILNLCLMEENSTVTVRDMELSIISMSKETPKFMFQIKDRYMTRLYIDCVVDDLDAFVENPEFRKALKIGIEVLHVNVDLYIDDIADSRGRGEHMLRSLLYLVKPKYAFPLGKTDIPESLTHLLTSNGPGRS